MKTKKSKIWDIDKQKLQEILDNSSSIVSALKTLGYNGYNGNYKTLNKRISIDGLSIEKLAINRTKERIAFCQKKIAKIPDCEVFCVNSTFVSNSSLKERLIQKGRIYMCEKCENAGLWEGSPISLQLDHINGISNDNREENLRFLCPNCHSQTETFSGKAKKRPKKMCPSCGGSWAGYGKQCHKCDRKNRESIKWPTLSKVLELLESHSMVKVGEMLGCSDNAVRKFIKRAS